MEKLDICNVIEIQKIREILINQPDLLIMFEILINIANVRINEEKPCLSLPLEYNEEPPLSDHSSDSDVSDDD